MHSITEEISCKIGAAAQKSLLLELVAYPKPGLVTPFSNGSHQDMNFMTFVKSIAALGLCFRECAAAGSDTSSLDRRDVLTYLKEIGRKGEKAMYKATLGVNTHKGAIFLLGLLCGAAGRLAKSQLTLTPSALAETASAFVQGIVERELKNRGSLEGTSGERAYANYGITGARGEAERGFPLALKASIKLKVLETEGYGFYSRAYAAHVLMEIIAENADTNLIARGGIAALHDVQLMAKEVLAAGGMLVDKGRSKIYEMEKEMIKRNLSPGGSADILSAAIFMNQLSLNFQDSGSFQRV